MNADPSYRLRAKLLAEALRPVGRTIAMRINRRCFPSRHEVRVVAVVAHHLGALQTLIRRWGGCVDDLMRDVLSNPVATAADIDRIANQLAACIDELCSGYARAYALGLSGRDAAVRYQLAGVYRHTLREIQVWIEQLIRTLSNPRAELRRRGLPTSGNIDVQVPLTLTAAPELTDLFRWIAERGGEHLEYGATARKSGSGILRAAGNLLLALGFAEVLSGDD